MRLSLAVVVLATAAAASPQAAQARVFTGDGQNFYVVQSTEDFGLGEPGYADVLLLRLSIDGDSWFSTWGSALDGDTQRADGTVAVAMDGSGNAYVLGYHGLGGPFPTPGAFVLKFSSSGELLGARRFSWSNHYLFPADFTVDDAGNIYITGIAIFDTGGLGNEPTWAFTWKCNPGGNVVWAKRWCVDVNIDGQPVPSGEGKAIGVDSYGDVWVAGEALLKYSGADGALLSAQTWSTSSSWFPSLLTIDDYDNVYVCGQLLGGYFTDWFYSDLQVPNHDIVVLKYGASGALQWSQVFGTGLPEEPLAICTDSRGRLYVVGETTNTYMPPVGSIVNGDPDTDGLALIFDAAGPMVQARKTVGLPDDSYKESILGIFFGADDELYNYGRYGLFESQLMDVKGGYWQVSGTVGYPVASEDELSACSLEDLESGQDTMPLSLEQAEAMLFASLGEYNIGKGVWDDPALPEP